MMKILFYFLIPILSFFSFQQVNAFSMDKTPNICVRNYQGNVNCSYKGEIAKFWDNNYWTTNNYLGSAGSTTPINDLISFQWTDYNLCKGKSMLISGYIGGLFGYFDANSSYEIYNNDSQMNCAYTRVDSSRLKFTCSGIGGGDLIFNFNLNSWHSQETYQPAISQNVDITCNATNDTIITENKQNTQDIIDNANQNQSQTNSRLDNVNGSLNDINGSLNDSSIDGAKTDFDKIMNDNSFDVNNTPISSLVTLPLKILNVYNDAVTSTDNRDSCPSLDMGKMFGVNWLEMPCIYPEKYLGSTLWAMIDIVTTALLLWSLSHQLIRIYINFTSLDGKMTEKIVTQTGGML